ncbi:MAG: UDP-2,3-diacylglucosamine diphosphatase [Gammaproteobacteria bacterium]
MAATLFIADLHLDGARPHIIERFIEFLRTQASAADALYILGDLYEYWLGDDASAPALQPTIAALAALTARGVPVYFIHGNRDFLIGQEFARQSGCELLPEDAVIDLYGEPTLIMHGDTLCTDDKAYQSFRAKIRHPLVRKILLSLSVNVRRRLARHLRGQSRQAIGGKRPEIMDVNAQAVRDAMSRHGVRRLIHGHTHRPAVHTLDIGGLPATRYVLGDWYEQGSVLRCAAQGCELMALRK